MFGVLKSWNTSSPKYMALQDDLEDDLKVQPRTSSAVLDAQKFIIVKFLPWILTTFFATLSAYLIFGARNVPKCRNSCSAAYATDFGPAKSAIKFEEVKFNGGPSFHENKTLYIPNPDPIRYVGTPSAEIDKAWEDLTDARYILITEEEARDTWGEEYVEFWDPYRGGYEVGLDVFHTLHCLNNMRKMFYPDIYPSHDTPDTRLHRDHCIEQLRQYIMCAGDITPIPTRYFKSVDRNYVDSDRVHTCRNFQMLRDWTTERHHGSRAVQPDFSRQHNV